MVIEFLNVQGNVVQAIPCIEFGAKYITVPFMMGMLLHYTQVEGFAGFRFRIGCARTSAVMVL